MKYAKPIQEKSDKGGLYVRLPEELGEILSAYVEAINDSGRYAPTSKQDVIRGLIQDFAGTLKTSRHRAPYATQAKLVVKVAE